MPRRNGPGGVRKGAGRPPLGADARSETVRVRLTPAELRELSKYCSTNYPHLDWPDFLRARLMIGVPGYVGEKANGWPAGSLRQR